MFDKRDNIALCTRVESEWAATAMRKLPKTLQEDFKAFILAQDEHYQYTATSAPKKAASIISWFQYFAAFNGRKQHIEDKFDDTLEDIKQCELVRTRSFFDKRGRKEVPKSLQRSESKENMHAGIMSLDDTTLTLKDFWPQSQFHAKSTFSPSKLAESTALKLHATGAPFIAGASGTIETLIFDLKHAVNDGRNFKETNFETFILLYAIGLVAAGHHSLSEIILVAQAFGFFEDAPDPRKNYVAFLCEIAKYCKLNGLAHQELDDILSMQHVQNLLLAVLNHVREMHTQKKTPCPKSIITLIQQLKSSQNSSLSKILTTIKETLAKDYTELSKEVAPYLTVAQDIIAQTPLQPHSIESEKKARDSVKSSTEPLDTHIAKPIAAAIPETLFTPITLFCVSAIKVVKRAAGCTKPLCESKPDQIQGPQDQSMDETSSTHSKSMSTMTL